jgi:hypothetical protein
MADPGLLTYSTVPIEIVAVARRDTANTPVTLKLNCESTTGYKDALPYDIPDSKEWHRAV